MYAEKSFNSPIQKTTENQMTNRDLGLNVILSKRKSKRMKLFFKQFLILRTYSIFVEIKISKIWRISFLI
jgi:hypothetical protein